MTAAPSTGGVRPEAAAELGLEVDGLTVRFGGVLAAEDVSFTVPPGRVVGLIGPNGAGKTTVLDAISGLVPLARGHVALAGRRLDRLATHRRARAGLGRTFQALGLFEDLTVAENLSVAAEAAGKPPPSSRVLGRLGLSEVAATLPLELSHTARSLLSLGRALVSGPTVLLLDEPAAGLDRRGRQALGRRVRDLADEGLGVLLVEHDLDLVFEVCDEVLVLDQGRLIARGRPEAVRDDPRVRGAYAIRPDASGPDVSGPDVSGPDVSGARPPGAPGGGPRPAAILEVAGLAAGYGGFPVVSDISLHVGAGEVVALLGVNGAGRTTTLAAIAGALRRMAGHVRIQGDAITRTEVLARHGLGYVPAARSLFSELTVSENLRLAARRDATSALPPAFRVADVLLGRRAGLLSGGEARLVALARALTRRPRVLLIDDLSLGLAPSVMESLLGSLRVLANETGLAVLLVEQHADLALGVADRAYVLERGVISGGGPAGEIDLSVFSGL